MTTWHAAVAIQRLIESGRLRARVTNDLALVLERPELDVDAVAAAVAERLTAAEGDGLVDAATLAKLLGVSRAYVYDNSDALGAIPVGDGPRPRLRFDVQRALESRKQDVPPKRAPRRRRNRASLTPEVAGSTVAPSIKAPRQRGNAPGHGNRRVSPDARTK